MSNQGSAPAYVSPRLRYSCGGSQKKLGFKRQPREKTHSRPADTFDARNWRDESKRKQNDADVMCLGNKFKTGRVKRNQHKLCPGVVSGSYTGIWGPQWVLGSFSRKLQTI